jgi:hypothetical protein
MAGRELLPQPPFTFSPSRLQRAWRRLTARKMNPAVECSFVVQALMGPPPGTLYGSTGQ